MKPMLAFKWADKGHTYQLPYYVQPKLNGVRMLYQNGVCQSRDEHVYSDFMLTHIKTALSDIPPNFILDGELYKHGVSRQIINGAASVNRLMPNDITPTIEYWVFDIIDTENLTASFTERHMKLKQLLSFVGHPVNLVATVQINDSQEAETLYKHWKDGNFEGMMYRNAVAEYGLEQSCTNKQNRWSHILKRKEWIDAEFSCVGIELGEGKYSEKVGALVFQTDDGKTFSAGSGLSDLQREEYVSLSPVGRLFNIRYEMLSDEGIPLQPRVEAEVDDR